MRPVQSARRFLEILTKLPWETSPSSTRLPASTAPPTPWILVSTCARPWRTSRYSSGGICTAPRLAEEDELLRRLFGWEDHMACPKTSGRSDYAWAPILTRPVRPVLSWPCPPSTALSEGAHCLT